jgi:hypothetical protein
MVITAAEWARYRDRLSQISRRAAELMQQYVWDHGYEVNDKLIAYAYSLETQFGEAAAELACIMYDDMAAYWAMFSPERMAFESAIPAETATYGETAAAMKAVGEESPSTIPDVVGRMVKRAAADTTMQNAIRDGAQFAWIPSGDTCAFCLTLASRGWQYASKKSIKNGHAEHIHSNCDCQYAVRFDTETRYAGYDPDKYKKMYDEADGDTPKDKINAMRREFYEEDKDRINEQKREAYARRAEESELYEP